MEGGGGAAGAVAVCGGAGALTGLAFDFAAACFGAAGLAAACFGGFAGLVCACLGGGASRGASVVAAGSWFTAALIWTWRFCNSPGPGGGSSPVAGAACAGATRTAGAWP